MAKPRTLADLKSHPLVDEIWFEEFDEGQEYCLSLKEPYWFELEESIWIHYKTVKELISYFYPSVKDPY